MKPFSDNIIFIDTEFSTLDPYEGEILSIGLMKLDGQELYMELEYNGEVSEWVKNNIVPNLKEVKISRKEAVLKIKKFIGDTKPYMIGYVNQFDAIYWYKLFSPEDNPCYWIPIDFASMLFISGIDPEKISLEDALDDAKLLREVYLKFIKV